MSAAQIPTPKNSRELYNLMPARQFTGLDSAGKLRLDLNVIKESMESTIHDIAFREVVIRYAGTMFDDEEFKDQAIRVMGADEYHYARGQFSTLSQQKKNEMRRWAAAIAMGLPKSEWPPFPMDPKRLLERDLGPIVQTVTVLLGLGILIVAIIWTLNR